MTENDNGWGEYRRMVLDWHEQDVQDRKEIRTRLEAQERSVNEKLDAISLQLAEICVERRIGKWALGGGIAGFLSLATTVGLKLLNLL